MSYLDSYLQRKREEREAGKYEIDDTPGEKFQAFTNNVGTILASALKNIRKERSIAGTPGSMAIESNAYESVARKVSADEVKAIGAFSETLGKGSTVTNQRLKEAVGSLRSMSDTLKDMFNDTLSQRRKSEAYSKRGDAGPSSASGASPLSGANSASKGSGIFDYLDWRKKDRPRPMGTPSPEKMPTGEKGGWWGRIKDKMAGGAKEGGGLFKKIGGGLKGAGLVGALVGASSLYEAATGEGDNTKNASKVAGSMAGGALGWQAGATAGGALGALGGPAAPITVPLGALIGGLAGAWGGSEIGDAVADSMVDVVRNFDSVPEQIQKVYKNDIVPGFDKASSFLSDSASSLSATAGEMGGAVASAFSGLTKTLSDFGDDVAGDVGKATRFAVTLPGRAVEAGKEAVKTGADAAKSVAKRADVASGGMLRQAVDAIQGENKGIGKVRATGDEMAAIQAGREKGEKFRIGSGLTQDTKDMIADVSKKHGVSADYMTTMAMLESGGNPNAVSPTGAVGLYQFTGRTAKGYGLNNRFDKNANADAAARLAKDNGAYLERKGIKATPENLYLAHQLGMEGARNLISAASGKEALTEKTKSAMGNNYGNIGAQEYLDKNSRVWASKAEQAKATTDRQYANLGTNGKPYDVASASKDLPTNSADRVATGKIGERKAAPVDVAKAPVKVPEQANPEKEFKVTVAKSQPQAVVATPSTLAPSVEARRAPVERVASSEPPESKPVMLTNPDAIRQSDGNREVAQVESRTRVVQDSQIPTLDNMPLMISDLGLMLLNVGHI